MKKIHAHRCQLSTRETVETGELKRAEVLAAEIEEGNSEYKFKLTNLSDDQFIHRITQLNWRLNEGGDEAVYEIGVEDDGNPLGLSPEDLEESLLNLKRMADSVGCDMTVQQFLEGEVGVTAKVLLRRTERLLIAPVQVQVAVAGPADTGKSTLIAVLSSSNGLDNGKGLARTQVFRHNHEVMSGRTSSNTQHNLYFGADGNVLNSDVEGNCTGSGKGCSNRLRSRSDMELADETCRTVSFIDLAGSSKYLKTTLHGIVGHSPDYFILVISAKKGMEQMTSEFLGLCFALQLNLLIVITKIDTVSPTVTAGVVGRLVKMLSRKGSDTVGGREAVHIESPDQLVNLILEGTEDKERGSEEGPVATVVPIFLVSSVTGEGLDLLRSHLFQLPNHTRSWTEARAKLTQVRIIGSFEKRDEKVCALDAISEAVEGGISETPAAASDSEYTTSNPVSRVSSVVFRTPIATMHMADDDADSKSSDSSDRDRDRIRGSRQCDLGQSDVDVTDDATSIASLWMDGAKSPSPPPNFSPSSSQRSRPLVPQEFDTARQALFDSEFTLNRTDESDDPEPSSGSDEKPSSALVASSLMGPDTVLFGQILSGVLSQGDRLVLGPIGIEGAFSLCSIQSVRVNDVPVRSAVAGQTATMVLMQELQESKSSSSVLISAESVSIDIASGKVVHSSTVSLDSISSGMTSTVTGDSSDGSRVRDSVGRVRAPVAQGASISAGSGLVLLSPAFNPIAYWEFEAEVLIINHPGKIRVSYEPVVHFLGCCVRQSARIVDIKKLSPPSSMASTASSSMADKAGIDASPSVSEVALLSGDKAVCRFRFLYRPEYIFLSPTSDNAMVMREGRTKGVGKILSLSCPSAAACATPLTISHARA